MVTTAEAAAMATADRTPHRRAPGAMRAALVALSLLNAPTMAVTPAAAQVSVGISVPGISIGINQPFYPELALVPGLPVYYAPRAQSNYFFYDGLFWVYQDDRWYSSAWYDGPWELVDPYYVPLFLLRVPVQYYVRPPVYFHGWVLAAPPRWDIHWGLRWAQHRRGWDHWDYRAIPRPAPPPLYQRYYSGERYPQPEHQRGLREEHYRYQPRDASVRRHFEARPGYHAPPPVQIMPPNRTEAPRAQYPQRDRDDERRPVAQPVPLQRENIAQEQRLQPHDTGRRMQPAAPLVVQPQAGLRPRGMRRLYRADR